MTRKAFLPRIYYPVRVVAMLAALLAVFLVATVTTPNAWATDKFDDGLPSVEITGITPEILTNETEVVVSLHVSGIDPASRPYVSIFMQADPLRSLSEVEDFLEGSGGRVWSSGELSLTPEQIQEAASAEGVTIEVELPVDGLPLWNTRAWGPYGVEARLLTSDYRRIEVPNDYSLLIWYPETPEDFEPAKTSLNFLLPCNSEPSFVENLTVNVRDGVTVSVTPTQIPLISANSKDQTIEAVVRPLEDADLSMLASIGQNELFELGASSRNLFTQYLNQSKTRSSNESTDSNNSDDPKQTAGGLQLVDDVIVATDGWLSLSLLKQANSQTVLTAPNGLDTLDVAVVTPSSKFLASPIDGSTLLTETAPTDSQTVIDSWKEMASLFATPANSKSDFDVEQQIRALTALVTLEDESDERYLWVHLPNTVPSEKIRSRLSAALDAPWIQPVSLTQILEGPTSQIPRQDIGEANRDLVEETSKILAPIGEVFNLALEISNSSSVGAETYDAARQPILYTAASGLTPEERLDRVNEVLPELKKQFDIIEVAPNRTVNVMNHDAEFPVTLTNTGNFPVTVQVGLETGDVRLQTKDTVEVTVPASGSVIAQIPVAAVGSGNVSVLVVAKTPGGTILDASQEIDVRVRAGLEDTLWWIVAGSLSVLFIFGLVRTIRKGRRPAGQLRVEN